MAPNDDLEWFIIFHRVNCYQRFSLLYLKNIIFSNFSVLSKCQQRWEHSHCDIGFVHHFSNEKQLF
jgi:hypothetical protein